MSVDLRVTVFDGQVGLWLMESDTSDDTCVVLHPSVARSVSESLAAAADDAEARAAA